MRNSVQGTGDRFFWNQVHGRKIYVQRYSAEGSTLVGVWKVYPKWNKA